MDEKQLAEKFHEIYERLAPSFGYETRQETRKFDPDSANGKLMIAVCAEILGGHLINTEGMLIGMLERNKRMIAHLQTLIWSIRHPDQFDGMGAAADAEEYWRVCNDANLEIYKILDGKNSEA